MESVKERILAALASPLNSEPNTALQALAAGQDVHERDLYHALGEPGGGEFQLALKELVREGALGRSYFYGGDFPEIPGLSVGRQYYVWKRTRETAQLDARRAQADRKWVAQLRSLDPGYGDTLFFGHDDDLIELR